MDDYFPTYLVGWETKIAPGVTHYRGSIRVMAEDPSRAEQAALREVARRACFKISMLRVVSVEEVKHGRC